MNQGRRFDSFSDASSFLWSIADLLRGDYKQHDYGKVILPFTVLRRLDCAPGPREGGARDLGHGPVVTGQIDITAKETAV